MKWKTIVFLFIVIATIFMIYMLNIDSKTYYVDISDRVDETKTYSDYINEYLINTKKLEKFINQFSNKDYRITDLIRDIEDNKVIKINGKEQTLQNALIKADILTIRMGDNELNYKIDTTEINELFDYCDTLIEDIEKLFELLKKYCKEDIYFLGLYNNHSDYYDEIYNYLNLKIADLCDDYDIHFIKINDLNKENEHIRISESIIESNIMD